MNETKKRPTSFLKRKESLTGKILVGKYRYLNVLGEGGMGEVHLVVDIQTEQKLAMKCCRNESSAERFEREVLSWMKISRHPNLVRAIYFDRIDNVPSLFIEYVEGTNLKDIIEGSERNQKDIPFNIVMDYAIQICRGMAHLHRHGIIHRDLKPSNILIASEKQGPGQIKITDMGLSKVKGISDVLNIESDTKTPETGFILPELTQTQEMLGTPQYMSPQQYAYSKGVAEGTDIYAFGVICYEMLTRGKRPFDAVNNQGWFYAHTFQEPKHIKTQISSRFKIFHRKSRNLLYELVMQCLAKKISERPQTFGEIEEKLYSLYAEICGEKYPRGLSFKVEGMSHQEMNNQAVSLMEMGGQYIEEGWNKLAKLCASSRECIEAHLNKLLYQLKNDQVSLLDFWLQGKKFLTEQETQSHKIIELLLGAAVEKGSFYVQSWQLLQSITNVEQYPMLLRLKAKLLYLGGKYTEAVQIFENLSQEACSNKEDYYHWAGCLIHLALQNQEARLCLQQDTFSLELERSHKQKIWYILRQGEEKCGSNPWFESAKDITVGGQIPITPFWHEHAVLSLGDREIKCLSICANWKYAVSGQGREIILWHLERKKQIFSFQGHVDYVTSVVVDAEGKYALSGSKDGTICLWDLHACKLMESHSHRAPVTHVAFNCDRAMAISVGIDGIVKIWNLRTISSRKKFWGLFTRKLCHTFSPGCGELTSISMSLDSRHMLAGSQSGALLLWDLEYPHKPPVNLPGHMGNITGVVISADGKWAISCSNWERSNVFIWDIGKKEKLLCFTGIKQGILKMAIGGNAHWLFLTGEDGVIHVWDIKKTKSKIASLEGHEGQITGIASTFQGDTMVSCANDGMIRVWKNEFIWPVIQEQGYLKVL